MCGAAFHDPKSSHFGSSLTNRSRHGRSAKRRRLWCLAASPPPMPRRDRVLISTWSWPWPANVPDPLNVQSASNRTTPASYEAALRAHFLQGHRWVQQGTLPPASTHLRTAQGNKLERDANGNVITVDASGRPVPRLHPTPLCGDTIVAILAFRCARTRSRSIGAARVKRNPLDGTYIK